MCSTQAFWDCILSPFVNSDPRRACLTERRVDSKFTLTNIDVGNSDSGYINHER